MEIKYLDQVRARNPLVHNITNIVAANFSANGLLAIGASPIMADSVDEMAELAAVSSAVVLNIGTLNKQKVEWHAKGVDAGSGSADLHSIAQRIAQQYGCVAAISGETDYVSNGSRTAKLNNGTPLFPKVTASGCLLSTIVGAFAAVAAQEDYLHAVAEACTVYAVAGELAAQGLQPSQSGSFAWKLIDSLAAVSAQEVAARAKVEWI